MTQTHRARKVTRTKHWTPLVRFLSDPQADFVAIASMIPRCERCGQAVEWDIDENSFDDGVSVTVVRSSGWANTHVFQNAIVGERLFGKR